MSEAPATAKVITGVTSGTFQHLALNAGAILVNFDIDTYATATALRAAFKAELSSGTHMLGATRGGGAFRATPETRTVEADGKRYGFVGDTIVDAVDVSLTGTLLEVKPENLQKVLASGKVTKTDKKTTVTMDTDIDSSDYLDKVCWIGDMSNGKLIAIEIYNALNTNGLDFTFADKGETTIPFEFHAHQTAVDDYDTAPFKIIFLED